MLAKSSPIFMQCAQSLLTTHLTSHLKPGMKQFLNVVARKELYLVQVNPSSMQAIKWRRSSSTNHLKELKEACSLSCAERKPRQD